MRRTEASPIPAPPQTSSLWTPPSDSGSDSDLDGNSSRPQPDAPGQWQAPQPGTFSFGSPATEPGRDLAVYDDLDATDAAVTREFWIMETEVTQEQFESEMGYHPSQFTACGATCPVENLLWDELAAYANALSILDGLENCYECSGSGTDVAKTPQFLST